MRRTLVLLMPVLFAGCFFGGNGNRPAETTDAGPATADRDRTLEYWGKLRASMTQPPKSADLKALTEVIRQQVAAVRGESGDGVDPELVAVAEALAASQEKVIEMAEVADFQVSALQASPQLRQSFDASNKQSSAAAARLKALRGKLTARYGVAFPPLEG